MDITRLPLGSVLFVWHPAHGHSSDNHNLDSGLRGSRLGYLSRRKDDMYCCTSFSPLPARPAALFLKKRKTKRNLCIHVSNLSSSTDRAAFGNVGVLALIS